MCFYKENIDNRMSIYSYIWCPCLADVGSLWWFQKKKQRGGKRLFSSSQGAQRTEPTSQNCGEKEAEQMYGPRARTGGNCPSPSNALVVHPCPLPFLHLWDEAYYLSPYTRLVPGLGLARQRRIGPWKVVTSVGYF